MMFIQHILKDVEEGRWKATILFSPIYFSSKSDDYTPENNQDIDTGTKLII